MLMPVFLVTVGIIMGKGHQWAVLKGEGKRRRSSRRQKSGPATGVGPWRKH
ncbi:Uncharacterised protein [Klebsiella pneumoniae]|nr:Uncharacterised protein [Klebsiella pneumoniae]